MSIKPSALAVYLAVKNTASEIEKKRPLRQDEKALLADLRAKAEKSCRVR